MLEISGNSTQPETVRVRAAKCTIGSADACTIRLNDPEVHAVHCVILRGRRQDDRSSLGRHGLAERALVRDAELHVGDVVSFASIQIRVVADERQAADTELTEKLAAAEQRVEELARHAQVVNERIRQVESGSSELSSPAQTELLARLARLARRKTRARTAHRHAVGATPERTARQWTCDLERLNADIARLQDRMPPDDGTPTNIDIERAELEQLRAQLTQQQQELTEHREALAAEKVQLAKQTAENEQTSAAQEEQAKQLQEQTNQLEERSTELTRQEEELAEKQQQLQQRQAEFEQLQQERDELKEKQQEFDTRQEESQREFERLQEEKQQELDRLQEEKQQELDRLQAEKQQELDRLQEEKQQEFEQHQNEQQEELDQLNSQLAELQEKQTNYEADQEKFAAQEEEHEGQLEQLNQQLEEARKSVAEEREEADQLLTELTELEAERDTLQKEVAEWERKAKDPPPPVPGIPSAAASVLGALGLGGNSDRDEILQTPVEPHGPNEIPKPAQDPIDALLKVTNSDDEDPLSYASRVASEMGGQVIDRKTEQSDDGEHRDGEEAHSHFIDLEEDQSFQDAFTDQPAAEHPTNDDREYRDGEEAHSHFIDLEEDQSFQDAFTDQPAAEHPTNDDREYRDGEEAHSHFIDLEEDQSFQDAFTDQPAAEHPTNDDGEHRDGEEAHSHVIDLEEDQSFQDAFTDQPVSELTTPAEAADLSETSCPAHSHFIDLDEGGDIYATDQPAEHDGENWPQDEPDQPYEPATADDADSGQPEFSDPSCPSHSHFIDLDEGGDIYSADQPAEHDGENWPQDEVSGSYEPAAADDAEYQQPSLSETSCPTHSHFIDLDEGGDIFATDQPADHDGENRQQNEAYEQATTNAPYEQPALSDTNCPAHSHFIDLEGGQPIHPQAADETTDSNEWTETDELHPDEVFPDGLFPNGPLDDTSADATAVNPEEAFRSKLEGSSELDYAAVAEDRLTDQPADPAAVDPHEAGHYPDEQSLEPVASEEDLLSRLQASIDHDADHAAARTDDPEADWHPDAGAPQQVDWQQPPTAAEMEPQAHEQPHDQPAADQSADPADDQFQASPDQPWSEQQPVEGPVPADESQYQEYAPVTEDELRFESVEPVDPGQLETAALLEKYDLQEEVPYEETAPAPPVAAEPEPPAAAASGEESIENYMQQLLQRVSPGSSTAGPTPAVTQQASGVPVDQPVVGPPPVQDMKPRRTPSRNVVALDDLAAMRELANESARSAINRHAHHSTRAMRFANMCFSIICALAAAIFFVVANYEVNLWLILFAVAASISLFFLYKTFTITRSRLAKAAKPKKGNARGKDVQVEHEPVDQEPANYPQSDMPAPIDPQLATGHEASTHFPAPATELPGTNFNPPQTA